MKKAVGLILCVVLVFGNLAFADSGMSKPVEKKTETIVVDGVTKTVTVVWADLTDKSVRINSVAAKDKIGQTAPLKEIVDSVNSEQETALAGINGTFFSAYTDMQAEGTILSDGVVEHISNKGSMFTVDGSNHADVIDGRMFIEGSTQDQWLWPFNWYAWNINHYYGSADTVMLFDKDYDGPKPTHDFTAVKVEKGIVTVISVGAFDIPSEGFLVLTKNQNVLDVFKLGYTADYRIRYENSDKELLNSYFETVRTGVGAGPILVKDGVIIADAKSEGFTETKITENKAGRSIIGVRQDGVVGMAVLSNVTVLEAAEIAKALGMVDAINLDGGGSSALYASGSYVAGPGRNISNAVVVSQLKQPLITIMLNDAPLFFDAEPFVEKSVNRTVVPLRGIAEALGAQVGWDPATSSITLTRYGTVIKMKMGSNELDVNGEITIMDMPVTKRLGRSFVPVRVITDLFGGEVGWDATTKTVSLKIELVEDVLASANSDFNSKNYTAAKQTYEKVLDLDSNQITAIKNLAYIHNVVDKNYARAIGYYEKARTFDKNDSATLGGLAWTYYSNTDYTKAIEAFTSLNELTPDAATGYYGIALCYSSYSVQNVEQAKVYFELALEKGLNDEQTKNAQNYISSH
ncbi:MULTISPECIES: stalk domain-containing protein [unclassified Fusibacter]|uniref:stalk domain-containing protein n=1 Tax=unclassified Fusibacter TaxID=2624464 RepID=UPI0010108D41|nr:MULTISPECIES: stalk domain-containing protein [unclassified Fusibacter]MCK8060620.1 stalk domain-containing protein [Fusibacter sp. A2]NPE22926.1 hypothetical protein [Fusibacter sp. A1]RXV59993.1 hypothetical protein DWB64_13860 [Fusibacter sp. A1]